MKIKRLPTVISFVVVITGLVFFTCLSAYSAEDPRYSGYSDAINNATITGDGVRARNVPSTLAGIVETFSKGTRIEVVGETDFTDTIDGYSAHWYKVSWYKVSLGMHFGFVFGQYIVPDAGANVPVLSMGKDLDLMNAFIIRGHDALGDTKSEVLKKLGPPLSETKKKNKCAMPGEESFYYTLTYKDVLFRGYGLEESDFPIYSVTYTTSAYNFLGLKVGSSVSDVERLLGKGQRYSDDGIHDSSTLYYYGETYFYADFETDGKKVTAMTFTLGEMECDETW
jgi:hypothetical protein